MKQKTTSTSCALVVSQSSESNISDRGHRVMSHEDKLKLPISELTPWRPSMCPMGKGKACQTPGWSRGGPLCSLVPILPLQDHFQWPRDCLMVQGSPQKKRPCPKDTFKVLSVRHWGIRPSVWSRGGSLCSLVPMQWLEGCQTGAFSSARLLRAKKRPCPAEAFKVTPMKHWSIQPLIWARQGSLGSLVPIQLLGGPLL